MGTVNLSGEVDLSLRGDPAGFVRILDDNKILIPERPGNKIADSLTNIITNPKIMIILLVPGSVETLILTGNGKLTAFVALLKTSMIKNKIPKIGIELTVNKVCFGANQTLAKLGLWDKDSFVDRSTLPSLGRIVTEQIQSVGKSPVGGTIFGRAFRKLVIILVNIMIKLDYKKNLY